MQRFLPDVGAWWTRVQPRLRSQWKRMRPQMAPYVLAVTLVSPMGGILVSRAHLVDTAEAETARVEKTVAAPAAEVATAASTETSAVGDAWRAKALERARDDTAARFARRYNISLGLAREIHRAAVAEGIDPRIAFGLVKTESSFRRTVVSYAGAVGYTQLLPSTARWIAPGTSRSDLFDTRTNLRIGFRYLRYLTDKYNGNTRLALLAYNRGPGTVDRLLRSGRDPSNGYARKVLRG